MERAGKRDEQSCETVRQLKKAVARTINNDIVLRWPATVAEDKDGRVAHGGLAGGEESSPQEFVRMSVGMKYW